VGDWDQCDALIDQVYERFDRCEVLLNNAGVSPLYGDLIDIAEGYYDNVQTVNLKGPFDSRCWWFISHCEQHRIHPSGRARAGRCMTAPKPGSMP
jgi:NADP-dependent 3-hydroxy acid dehydrogenase YdfG